MFRTSFLAVRLRSLFWQTLPNLSLSRPRPEKQIEVILINFADIFSERLLDFIRQRAVYQIGRLFIEFIENDFTKFLINSSCLTPVFFTMSP